MDADPTDLEDAGGQGDGNEEPPPEFALEPEDFGHVQILEMSLRTLLRRRKLAPAAIVAIGRMLYGLSRLPRPTPGLNVCLRLSYEEGGECIWQEAKLTTDEFSLESGGYEDCDAGGDGFSSTSFRVDVFGRECDDFELLGWTDCFESHCADQHFELGVEDDSAAKLDLSDGADGA